MKLIFFDLEVYPNLFLAVFYDPTTKEYKTFVIWEFGELRISQLKELKQSDSFQIANTRCLTIPV